MIDSSIGIYFNQRYAKTRKIVRKYTDFFNQQTPPIKVRILPSSADRTADIKQLRELRDQLDELLVVGGDGSVNIAAHALAFSECAVTVIPMGTGNDFARDHGIRDWRWRMKQPLVTQKESLGQIGNHVFVNHAGTGLTVDLIGLQPLWMKQVTGPLSYIIALLRYLMRPYHTRSSVHIGNVLVDGQIVALGRFVGGGIPINPEASRTEPRLLNMTIPRRGRWQQLMALLTIWRGRGSAVTWVPQQVGDDFKIGDDNQHWIELDGDVCVRAPLRVTCVDQALKVTQPALSQVSKRGN